MTDPSSPVRRLRRAGLFACSGLMAAGLLTADLGAQTQKELIAKRDAKLASAFLKKAAWNTDYDAARAAAKKAKKPIFAYFTRSFAP